MCPVGLLIVHASADSSPLLRIGRITFNPEMPLDIFRDWRPVTVRARSRETLAVGVRDLKEHLAKVMLVVARGDVRVVVRRHRDLMGALVPMPDYWFLVELEEELRRRRCPGVGRRVGAREVAEAVIELRERAVAAERKGIAELKHTEAAERREGGAQADGRGGTQERAGAQADGRGGTQERGRAQADGRGGTQQGHRAEGDRGSAAEAGETAER